MKIYFRILIASALLLWGFTQIVSASCMVPLSPPEELERADAVFVGTVTNIKTPLLDQTNNLLLQGIQILTVKRSKTTLSSLARIEQHRTRPNARGEYLSVSFIRRPVSTKYLFLNKTSSEARRKCTTLHPSTCNHR
jgi:hypothetical protein